jgi:GWxTD domain-containing protein
MRAKLLSVVLVFSFLAPAPAGAGDKIVLPERYQKWLDQEVVYIITSRERDVFLQLQTDKEREIFIGAFWRQRDPTPGTERNEFREEHYRRLQYANSMYGRSTPLPGWKTDRGRIYIILGAPKNIESYDQVMNVYPTEIWFYLGDASLGLPTGFNVIFFKRAGTGDYVLYSPTEDGPQSLIADSMGNFGDERAAYSALRKLEPNLAPQTLSLIPGERNTPDRMSLASSQLIRDIAASPQRKVQDSYAEAILRFKDFIEVEYTANYVPSDACLQVIQDDSGAFMVHYSIEPGKISVEEGDGKYEARFRLTGRISNSEGRTIYQFDKDFPFSLTPDQLQEVRAKSIAIQDMFPLVPGSYHFDILLKNTLSKEFTGAEKKVVIPADPQALQISPLLLAYGNEKKPGGTGEKIPFKAGDDQILCQSKKTFGTKDTLVLFFQVLGLKDELRSAGSLKYDFFKDDKEFSSRTRKVSSYQTGPGFLEVENLKDFPPGYYQIRVSLLDGDGKELLSQKENFEISFLPEIPRPFVVSKVMASFKKENYLFETGLQYFNKGDLAEAGTRLSGAYSMAPRRLEFAAAYAQVLFRLNDFKRAREILLPLAGGEDLPAEVLALLGQACHALGQYQEAITHYAAYLSRYGMNINILNYLGACYYQLGNREEALKAWTKSLELSANQEKIKALVESLKKK